LRIALVDNTPAGFKQIALRIPADLPERADALLPRLNARADQRARGGATRSDVLRLALILGIEHLERELAQKKGAKRTTR
jgi:hypothetical protein